LQAELQRFPAEKSFTDVRHQTNGCWSRAARVSNTHQNKTTKKISLEEKDNASPFNERGRTSSVLRGYVNSCTELFLSYKLKIRIVTTKRVEQRKNS
jgi:hypothetical protein